MNSSKVDITEKHLIDACVELVTVNGRPFTLMDDSGFKKILKPLQTALAQQRTKNKQESLSAESIKKYISLEAAEIRQMIMAEIGNNMVSIKADCVTRLDCSFLGVNIQYTKDDQIVLRTLALKEIKMQHAGYNLMNIILDICASFNITMSQIYTITTDYGANMLKGVKIMASENGEYDVIEENSGDESDCDNYYTESDNVEYIKIVLENDNDESNVELETKQRPEDKNDEIHDNVEMGKSIVSDHDSAASSTYSNLGLEITGMRCAAHTLQLAIEDGLKNETKIAAVITNARKIVKILRTQTFMDMLKKQQLKKPIIDCPTRWDSTFDMLQRLLELRDFCTEMVSTNLTFRNMPDSQWDKIKQIVVVLKLARKWTYKLQYEQLTIGSFYGYWQECKLSLKKIGSSFATVILRKMGDREVMLLDNEVILAGIFLDPRYKVVLDDNQVDRAKAHLKSLWTRLMFLKECNSSKSDPDQHDMETESSSDEMEAFLRHSEQKFLKEMNQHEFSSDSFVRLNKIENILNSYQVEQSRIRLRKNETIFDFWKKKKELNTELYMLAQVLLSVPATQVSVERLFSGLKFLLPPSKSNIKENILEEQLFVRTDRLFNRIEQTPSSITNNETFEIGILDKSNSSKDGEECEDMNQEEQSLNGNKSERRGIDEVVNLSENGKKRNELKS